MNIIQAIQERRSVRSYCNHPLSESLRNSLIEACNKVYNPFGGKFTFKLKSFDLKNGYKPSTYGFISGAEDFFLIGFDNEEISALSTGFCFEQVVLKACQLGLGTCWIAATFKDTDFDKDEVWPEGEQLRIVCPVGIAAKPNIKEKAMRLAVGSNFRKPFGRLFFNETFGKALEGDNQFAQSLSMMRLAPSSTNSQPWRAVVCGSSIHFYYKTKGQHSVLDCGIGLCHFYETERFNGQAGAFFLAYNAPTPPDNCRYIISYKRL